MQDHNSPVREDEENDFQPANIVTSDYAINVPNSSIRLPAQAATSEYAFPTLNQKRTTGEKKDEYASSELRELVNKALVDTKEKANGNRAHAITASKLRAQVSNLDDAVYVPTVMNGQLHFVSLNDDTRTARNRESSTTRTANLISAQSTSLENLKTANEGSLANYSLSLVELQEILGLEAVQAVLKKFKDNPSAFMKRARNRSRHRSTVTCATPSNASEKADTARSIETLVTRPEEGVFTAQEIEDGVIYTARSEGIRGLKYLNSDRSNIVTALDRDGFELTEENFADEKGRWKYGTPRKPVVDMRSRASPANSLSGYFNTAISDQHTALSHRDGAFTARSDSFTSLAGKRSRANSQSSVRSYNPLSDDTSTAHIIGSPYKATGDMRSRACPSSSHEKTARSDRSSTMTGVYGDDMAPVGRDMRSRAFPSSSYERTAEAKTSSTNTAVYGNQYGPVGGDMRSRAQPASSCERTADLKTSNTVTAQFGDMNGPVGYDMRSRAFPSSSYERTAEAKTSSTNTAVYGNQHGPVGGDMRSRAFPSSSHERTAQSTSQTNTAVFGDGVGPVRVDMRSRAQPASSNERTANAKTSSTNTALMNEAVGVDMRSRAFPSSSYERTAEAKTSSTNTAVYGNQYGPVGGDMRSRAYPTSAAERTARDLSEVTTAREGKEVDQIFNSLISQVTALGDGETNGSEEMRPAADRDNSLTQVHPSVLTQTPLSDCKAAAAVPSIGNFNQ